jgi:hypothetical protein
MLYRRKKIDYTVPSGHEGGPGMGKQITPYFGTPYLNMTLAQWQAVHQNIGACLGDTWTLGGQAPALGGNTFMFVRAREALALGQLVTPAWPTGTVGANAIYGDQDVVLLTIPGVPVSTSAAITTDYNNVGLVAANADVDNWIFVNPVATFATPQLRRIKAHTVSATATYTVAQRDFMRPNSPTDTDVFDGFAVFANLDPVVIIRPYEVMVNTATSVPTGVALGTVTAGNYTIIQIGGLASVQSVGDGTALAVNVEAYGDAAGVAIGSGGVANLYNQASQILPQIAQAAAGPIIIPCLVNFTAQ